MSNIVNLSKYKGVLSDLDGTILDTEAAKHDLFFKARDEAFGFFHAQDLISSLLREPGESSKKVFKRWYSEGQSPEIKVLKQQIMDRFFELYKQFKKDLYAQSNIFPDAQEVLSRLDPDKSMIVTGIGQELSLIHI